MLYRGLSGLISVPYFLQGFPTVLFSRKIEFRSRDFVTEAVSSSP